jgi:hypothetical protein
MSYRGRCDAKLRRRWAPRPRLTLALAQDIIKRRFAEEVDWFYGEVPYPWFLRPTRASLDERAARALRRNGMPATMTSIAEFRAAEYWRARKEGPSPVRYCKARHAARPYQ